MNDKLTNQAAQLSKEGINSNTQSHLFIDERTVFAGVKQFVTIVVCA